jgi:hypothetical protein
MLLMRAGGILLVFGAALPLVLSLVPSIQRGYYVNLTTRDFWQQLNPATLRLMEGWAGDPLGSFFGQLLSDLLHAPAWMVLGVPGVLLVIVSFVRRG